uniref:Metalloendopeptidase n=1 Tax=Colubraria reticulata TaxID=604273 RepID=A0A481SPI6_9CAEN|nr:CreM12-ShK3 [Colubraria reticulata]
MFRRCCLPVALCLVCLHPAIGSIDQVIRMANGKQVSASRTSTIRSRNGRLDRIDGMDMVLTESQYTRLYGGSGGVVKREASTIAIPWPDAVIPYTIKDGDFSAKERKWLRRSMKNWEAVSCVQFRPSTPNDSHKILIRVGNECLAHVGMLDKDGQEVTLHHSCFWKGTIDHELGHTIGLIHEHQRPQRDGYIRVNYYAVGSTSIGSLTKYAKGSDNKHGLEYDYNSIMHYGKTAFSEDWVTQTIFTRDPTQEDAIGMAMKPSFIDAKLVNLMYNCQDRCQSPPCCPDKCFVSQDCRCVCKEDIPKEICKDKAGKCPQWAKSGKCHSNESYMHTFCRKSCQICNDDGSPAHLPCVNGKKSCKRWAQNGECEKNRLFMHKHCRAACGYCKEGFDTLVKQGPCKDKNSSCVALAAKGECNRNPKTMLWDCRKSCDFCQENMGDDPTDKPGCVDYDTVCQYQAEFGMCRKFFALMVTECANHCGTCDLDVQFPADCEDNNVECRNWAASERCETDQDWMNKTCKKSCNFCPGLKIPEEIENQCLDNNPKCPGLAAKGKCSSDPVWMKNNCRDSCGICSNKTVPDTFSNFRPNWWPGGK